MRDEPSQPACEWHPLCTNTAMAIVEEPKVQPGVPACARCIDKHGLWDCIVGELPCPVCGANPAEDGEDCLHVWCSRHQRWTDVASERYYGAPAFQGGMITHVEYRCGCVEHDESDDVEAAN
jgi:hypothetical protein